MVQQLDPTEQAWEPMEQVLEDMEQVQEDMVQVQEHMVQVWEAMELLWQDQPMAKLQEEDLEQALFLQEEVWALWVFQLLGHMAEPLLPTSLDMEFKQLTTQGQQILVTMKSEMLWEQLVNIMSTLPTVFNTSITMFQALKAWLHPSLLMVKIKRICLLYMTFVKFNKKTKIAFVLYYHNHERLFGVF